MKPPAGPARGGHQAGRAIARYTPVAAAPHRAFVQTVGTDAIWLDYFESAAIRSAA
jgi:hypothetical protein